jgi:hypothetical protein
MTEAFTLLKGEARPRPKAEEEGGIEGAMPPLTKQEKPPKESCKKELAEQALVGNKARCRRNERAGGPDSSH